MQRAQARIEELEKAAGAEQAPGGSEEARRLRSEREELAQKLKQVVERYKALQSKAKGHTEHAGEEGQGAQVEPQS